MAVRRDKTGRWRYRKMVRLPDGFQGTLDAQLHSAARLPLPTVASLPLQPPGVRGVFAVDLQPGKYGFICFVEDPDGRKHSDKGMSSVFAVQ